MTLKLPPATVMYEGEQIEIGVSSEVKIDGHSNWISSKVIVQVQKGEDAQKAHRRGLTALHNQFEKSVNETVAKIRTMGE